MSGFRDLADASRDFITGLSEQAKELDVEADIILPPDEAIQRKLESLNLVNSKQTLVAASISEVSVPVELQERLAANDNVLESSANTIEDTIMNNAFVKAVVLSKEVRDLFQTSGNNLSLEERDSKEELIVLMQEQTLLEDQLLVIDEAQREKEERLQKLRVEWFETLAALKERQSQTSAQQENINMSQEREKLKSLVGRMELMRMLISRLITSKEYDWYKDPQKLVKLLPLTRQVHTLDQFTE